MVSRGVVHQKPKELSPPVNRFFKVMFGEDYSKVMYLPPEFAQTVQHLANQETEIEDSNGRRWSVTLSYVKGSLAFRKGWDKFFIDHSLEQGQFLVFNYKKGSHFVVHIFGKSACERTNFGDEMPRQNKRSRRDEGTTYEEQFQVADVNSGDKPASATSVASGSEFQTRETNLAVANADFGRTQPPSVSMNVEDLTCMINRDDGYNREEDRNFLYDLSSFEMQKKTSDTNKFQKVSSTKLDPSCTEIMENATELERAFDKEITPCHIGIAEQTETMADDTQMDVVRTCQIKGHSGDVLTDKFEKPLDTNLALSDTDIMEKTKTMRDDAEMAVIQTNQIKGREKGDDDQMFVICSSQTAGRSGDIASSKFYKKPPENRDLSKGMSDDASNFQNGNNHVLESHSESPSIGSNKIPDGVHGSKRRFRECSVSSSVLKDPFGKRAIKKEQVELEDEANGFPRVSSGKEPTNVCNRGEMFSRAVKVEHDMSYDISPSVDISPFSTEVTSKPYLELPAQFPSTRGRKTRVPGMIVYLRDSIGRLWPVLYREQTAFKALTVNWTKFCDENNIRPGDKCWFEVENGLQCIYRVNVTRKFGEFPHK